LLKGSVVETTEDVRDTQALRDSLGLLELFLVESYVIVLGDVLQG